jgi:hypothetical protein
MLRRKSSSSFYVIYTRHSCRNGKLWIPCHARNDKLGIQIIIPVPHHSLHSPIWGENKFHGDAVWIPASAGMTKGKITPPCLPLP